MIFFFSKYLSGYQQYAKSSQKNIIDVMSYLLNKVVNAIDGDGEENKNRFPKKQKKSIDIET